MIDACEKILHLLHNARVLFLRGLRNHVIRGIAQHVDAAVRHKRSSGSKRLRRSRKVRISRARKIDAQHLRQIVRKAHRVRERVVPGRLVTPLTERHARGPHAAPPNCANVWHASGPPQAS